MHDNPPSRSLSPEQRTERLAAQRDLLRYVPDWAKFRGIRQKSLAEGLGVTEGVMSRYFSGETIMPVGALRKIAVLLDAHVGDVIRPPPADGLGKLMEDTLNEMDRLGPEQWEKLLQVARGMRSER